MQSVNSLDELQSVLSKNNKVVVDLWAPWCGPCVAFSPRFEKMANDNPEVVFVKVNVDTAGDVGNQFNVRGIPTILFFKNGVEVDRSVGAPSDGDFATTLATKLS